jgi:hypothetical protein
MISFEALGRIILLFHKASSFPGTPPKSKAETKTFVSMTTDFTLIAPI